MSTLCVRRIGSAPSLDCCSSSIQPSVFTMGKHKFGTSRRGPSGIEVMEAVARITDPDAIVWRGDRFGEDQGVPILGTPLGHPDHVRAQLQSSSATHDQLIAKVPTLPDLQCVWMVLLYCCAARATLCGLCTQSCRQVLQPTMLRRCLSQLLFVDPALCVGTCPVCLCPWVALDSEAPH